tara:strand:+ start:30808 stop:31122 length:315 start_codon:yes stop_codon:yes gene_type:complete
MNRLILFVFFSFFSTLSFATILVVDSTNNSGYGSLRAAIDSASTGDTIKFNPILIAGGSDSIVLDSSIKGKQTVAFTTEKWSRGVYFVKVADGKNIIVRKLVLN